MSVRLPEPLRICQDGAGAHGPANEESRTGVKPACACRFVEAEDHVEVSANSFPRARFDDQGTPARDDSSSAITQRHPALLT